MTSFTQLGQQRDAFYPIRQWLESIEIKNVKLAHSLCKLIPSQCPFERDIMVFGKKLFHIPPMCKLNPFYEEVVGLRFKALCYLADECGEDVSAYC
jgi:Mo-dependent nitrogenase C-terminus